RALELEPSDLGVLGSRRAGLAHAADLDRILVGGPVRRGRVRGVGNGDEQGVALRLGLGQLGLGGAKLLFDRRELGELLGRRLAFELLPRPELLDRRQDRPPARVGGHERVEVGGRLGALAGERGPEALGTFAGRAKVDHGSESRSASRNWATPSSPAGGQTKRARAFTRASAFSTATP